MPLPSMLGHRSALVSASQVYRPSKLAGDKGYS